MSIFKLRKKRSFFWYIIIFIPGIIILGTIIGMLADNPERQELKALEIGSIDFTNLQDGVYMGEYSGSKGHFRDAAVEVTISGGEIIVIRILKGALDSDGNPAKISKDLTIADLFQNVIQLQSLQVDAISGATLSSKAHLKALENALNQAIRE